MLHWLSLLAVNAVPEEEVSLTFDPLPADVAWCMDHFYGDTFFIKGTPGSDFHYELKMGVSLSQINSTNHHWTDLGSYSGQAGSTQYFVNPVMDPDCPPAALWEASITLISGTQNQMTIARQTSPCVYEFTAELLCPGYTTEAPDNMWVTRKDTYWFRLDSITDEIPLETASQAAPMLFEIQPIPMSSVRNLDVSVDYGGYGLWPSEAKIVYTFEYLHEGRSFGPNDLEYFSSTVSGDSGEQNMCDIRYGAQNDILRVSGSHAVSKIKLTGAAIDWQVKATNLTGHMQCGSKSSQMTSQTLGYIIGFTIAGFILLVIAIICVWWYCKNRKEKSSEAKNPLVSIGYAGSWKEAQEKC